VNPDDKLARVPNSALFVDAVCFLRFRREADLTPEEQARCEWQHWRVSATGRRSETETTSVR
jgi:hypothetical protein